MTCTFLGHHDAPSSLYDTLKKEIERLIFEGVVNFTVGNNGSFDLMVQRILCEISKENSKIKISIVLSRINELAISGFQESTVFPEGLELAIPKFAICKRNEWLLGNAQILISYVRHTTSNSYKWLKKAKNQGLKIINLAEK